MDTKKFLTNLTHDIDYTTCLNLVHYFPSAIVLQISNTQQTTNLLYFRTELRWLDNR